MKDFMYSTYATTVRYDDDVSDDVASRAGGDIAMVGVGMVKLGVPVGFFLQIRADEKQRWALQTKLTPELVRK